MQSRFSKKYLSIFLMLLIYYSSFSKEFEYKDDSVHFVVSGKVNGLNGEKISLVIPSYKNQKRYTTIVKEGKFKFRGKIIDHDIFAELLLDQDVTNPTGIYDVFQFVLSEGETEISFNAIKNTNVHRYKFDSSKIIHGRSAKDYMKFRKILFENAYSNLTYKDDSLYLDSLHRLVFPHRRMLLENLYSQIKDSITSNYVKTKLLIDIAKSPLYQEDLLLGEDGKRFVVKEFNKLKPLILSHSDFNYYETYFLEEFQKKKIIFKDFELESINKKTVRLSDIIKNNEYTVLYFWWSACAPCRKFNQIEGANYSLLKQKNIEFVSINTDKLKFLWEKATSQDNIKWKNLFAGSISPILTHYQVNSFPTKIILNKNFEIIDLKFKTMNDLLKMIESRKTE